MVSPRRHDLAAAIRRFPRLLPERPTVESQALAAPGTDHIPYTPLTQTSDSGCNAVSLGVDGAGGAETAANCRKPLKIKGVESDSNSLRTDEEIGPTRIRTWNQGIMSPLLCR